MRNCRPAFADISPRILIYAAVLLLCIPLPWVTAGFLAALLHEAGHLFALRLLQKQARGFQIAENGTSIHIPPMTSFEELFCTAGGLMTSLCLSALYSLFPRLSICAFVQFVYNCIPVYPLDGGRLLSCILNLLVGPQRAENIVFHIGCFFLFTILLAGCWLSFGLKIGYVPLFVALSVAVKAVTRKRPCKSSHLRVQ